MKDSPTVSNEAAISSFDAPPTNDKSFDKPPAKKRKYFKCSVKSDQHKVLEYEELTEFNLEVKDLMQKYWGNIRSFTKKGKIQNIYNIFYDRDFKDLVETIAEGIMTHQKNRFKVNYSLAYILKKYRNKGATLLSLKLQQCLNLGNSFADKQSKRIIKLFEFIGGEILLRWLDSPRYEMEGGTNFKYYFLCEQPERFSSWSRSVLTKLHHKQSWTCKRCR